MSKLDKVHKAHSCGENRASQPVEQSVCWVKTEKGRIYPTLIHWAQGTGYTVLRPKCFEYISWFQNRLHNPQDFVLYIAPHLKDILGVVPSTKNLLLYIFVCILYIYICIYTTDMFHCFGRKWWIQNPDSIVAKKSSTNPIAPDCFLLEALQGLVADVLSWLWIYGLSKSSPRSSSNTWGCTVSIRRHSRGFVAMGTFAQSCLEMAHILILIVWMLKDEEDRLVRRSCGLQVVSGFLAGRFTLWGLQYQIGQ